MKISRAEDPSSNCLACLNGRINLSKNKKLPEISITYGREVVDHGRQLRVDMKTRCESWQYITTKQISQWKKDLVASDGFPNPHIWFFDTSQGFSFVAVFFLLLLFCIFCFLFVFFFVYCFLIYSNIHFFHSLLLKFFY